MDTVNILIADDQPRVRESLRALLETDPRLTVIGEARDGQEALTQVAALQPGLVIMDLEMPVMDGLTATTLLHAQPHPPAIIMLSIHSSVWAEAHARQAGVAAFVSKLDPPEHLMRAIYRVAHTDYHN